MPSSKQSVYTMVTSVNVIWLRFQHQLTDLKFTSICCWLFSSLVFTHTLTFARSFACLQKSEILLIWGRLKGLAWWIINIIINIIIAGTGTSIYMQCQQVGIFLQQKKWKKWQPEVEISRHIKHKSIDRKFLIWLRVFGYYNKTHKTFAFTQHS